MKTIEDTLPIAGSIHFSKVRGRLIQLAQEIAQVSKHLGELQEEQRQCMADAQEYLESVAPLKCILIRTDDTPILLDAFNCIYSTKEGIALVSTNVYDLKGKPMHIKAFHITIDEYLRLKVLNPQYDEP